jgi:putative transposase
MDLETTAQLFTDTLMTALWRRDRAGALLHHSDRGSQCISQQFQRLTAEQGVACSMSRAGNCSDNAAMGSFFSLLKKERTARKTYRPRDESNVDLSDYTDRFYNPGIRHSTLGYLSPVAFEEQAALA